MKEEKKLIKDKKKSGNAHKKPKKINENNCNDSSLLKTNSGAVDSNEKATTEKKELPASKKITVLSNIVIEPSIIKCTCVVYFNVLKNDLTCNACSKVFHVRCIPRKHKEHIPDSQDLHLFLCHRCFKIDDSASGDSDSSTSAKDIFEAVNKAKRNLF